MSALRLRVAHLASAALLAAACGHGQGGAAPGPSSGALPEGVVARVGTSLITADTVQRIAAAQRIEPARARDIAVRDALLARGAEERGLAGAPEVRLSVDGELGRRVLRRILAEARAAPLTDEELDQAAKRKWLEVDRPEGLRTVHAVARFTAKDDDAKKARARAVAEAIRAAVARVAERAAEMPAPAAVPSPQRRPSPASDDPDPLSAAFRAAAAAVPHEGVEVVVESLPAIAADGRVLAAGAPQAFDPEFSRAAAALGSRGVLGPVSESSFGAHVILMLERTPALVVTGDARRERLQGDIVNDRARAAERRLLAAYKDRRSVAPDAAGLLGLVTVER
jgi:peptidyl-prolyl cis-trans isomerase C